MIWVGATHLEAPSADMPSFGPPGFPFLLCWASRFWIGVWHDARKRMLMEQTYPGEAGDRAHFALGEKSFINDPRYICVNDKPIFLVYAPARFPMPPPSS